MRRTLIWLAAMVLLIGACAQDDAELRDCGDVADATVSLLLDLIDELGDLPPEEQEAMITEGEFPEVPDLDARREVVSDRADELNCTNLELLIAVRAPRLISDTSEAIGQLITNWVRAGEGFFSRLFGED